MPGQEKQAGQCLIAFRKEAGDFISHANGCIGVVMQIATLIGDFVTAKYGGKMAYLLCICHSKLKQQNQKTSP